MTAPTDFQRLMDRPVHTSPSGDEYFYTVKNPTTAPEVVRTSWDVYRDWLTTQLMYTSLQGDISDLQGDMSTAEGDISTLEGAVDILELAAGFYKNLIINGDMRVAQRSTSVASITATGYHALDRWRIDVYSLGTWTMSQEADGPAGTGIPTSMKLLCTSADASPAASDYLSVGQRIEGQTLQAILKGTANAKATTLQFWVKSNATGTYVVELWDADNNRISSAAYTVNVSGTWEKKTVTFPADTTGTLNNDAGYSLQLNFWLAAGSNLQGGALSSAWAATVNTNRCVGQRNLAALNNNYIQITGVQFEIGAEATDFEHIPVPYSSLRCYRYTRVMSVWVGVTGARTVFPLNMLQAPVITGGGSGFTYTGTTADMLVCYQTTAAQQTLTLDAEI